LNLNSNRTIIVWSHGAIVSSGVIDDFQVSAPSQQIGDRLVVDLKTRHAQEELSVVVRADVVEDVTDRQKDDTRNILSTESGVRLSGCGLTV